MIRNEILQPLEPPQRHPREDLALVRDPRFEDEVVGADPVGGDHEEVALVRIEIAHLARVQVLSPCDNGRRDVDGHLGSVLGRVRA